MTLKILNLSIPEAATVYNDALNVLTDKHPYYKVAFLDIFYDGLSNARAFVFYDESHKPIIAMPFYLRPIDQLIDNEQFFDITSTWGYSGPLYNDDLSENMLNIFWKNVDEWYKQNKVVSEFIRFNTNNNSSGYSGNLVPIMNIIKGKLSDAESIWENYNRKVRKNIRTAEREELYTKIYYKNVTSQNIDDFYKIFVHTMDRTNATNQYYNSKEKLSQFIEAFPDNAAIVLTYKGEIPVASEMILLSTDSIFSFLGGTLSDYFNMRPNEILKHDVNLWGLSKGFKYFVLGGGLGKEDGIFEYKRAFFPNDTYMFTTGRKIINQNIYDKLVQLTNQSESTDTDFFPLYRKVVSH
jgi:hypothetical protein